MCGRRTYNVIGKQDLTAVKRVIRPLSTGLWDCKGWSLVLHTSSQMGSIPIRSIGVDFGKRIEVTSLLKVGSIPADSAYSVSICTCDMEDPQVC